MRRVEITYTHPSLPYSRTVKVIAGTEYTYIINAHLKP